MKNSNSNNIPRLDYPYLSLPDINEDDIEKNNTADDYPLWEQNLEKEIQGFYDR